ncbi:hypothetical protein VPNG_09607 [Cytospora leucostoma]|uniref:FAD-binding PCMH-type domain-containing protein n=1 Tax=Cytospora leucostoma TaxID=1230097 RepID=A0A423VN56_9PEZI|nr:hypothetical protein VPNG_09607 [Cytospora leucostoma]
MSQPTEQEKSMASPTSIGAVACLALSAALSQQQVAIPGSTAYNASVGSYFSTQQESLKPACVVTPQTVQDVSTAVKTLFQLHEDGQDVLFAIRSGGHTSWAGASNIQDGPVIDLRSLKAIELSPDRSTVSVGAGASWGDIYEVLDPLGLSVNGGRAYGVGVGGLTLGSGISYTSSRYGWTCDTVSKFQVVLADGSIVEADSKSRPDLLWALKGGSNNLGIVTRITFDTFKQGPVWSGTMYHLASYADNIISEFIKFNSADSYDDYASVMTSFTYTQARGIAVISNLLAYTKEVEGTPATFEGFSAVPSIYNASSLTNVTGITKATEALSTSGSRNLNLATTLVSTTPVIKAAYEKWNASYPAIKDVANIIFCLVLEPLPPSIYKRHAAANALGLANRTEPLVVALLSVSWTNASDDNLVNSTSQALLDDINAAAKELGGSDPYIFANYAGKNQEVIASYGAESVRKLRAVRQEVDPEGFFTYQVPGGYKIPDN